MSNRIIKFRAWNPDSKKMTYTDGGYLHLGKSNFISNPEWYVSDGESSVAYSGRSILMQYTGLNDKNGKEIYEGDFVNYDKENFHNGLNGLAEWVCSGFYIAKHIPLFDLVENFADDIEVIGNLYEHPHLLPNTKADE